MLDVGSLVDRDLFLLRRKLDGWKFLFLFFAGFIGGVVTDERGRTSNRGILLLPTISNGSGRIGQRSLRVGEVRRLRYLIHVALGSHGVDHAETTAQVGDLVLVGRTTCGQVDSVTGGLGYIASLFHGGNQLQLR